MTHFHLKNWYLRCHYYHCCYAEQLFYSCLPCSLELFSLKPKYDIIFFTSRSIKMFLLNLISSFFISIPLKQKFISLNLRQIWHWFFMIIFFKLSIVVVGEIITLNCFFEGDIWIPIIRNHFGLDWVGFGWVGFGWVRLGWVGLG